MANGHKRSNNGKGEIMASDKITMVAPSDIVAPEGWNARFGDLTKESRKDPESGEDVSWEQFAASVKLEGVKVPVVARPIKGGKLELVSGFRRRLAAVQAGLKEIPVIIRELDEVQARLENIRENTARKDLKGADLAWSLAQLVKANPAFAQHGGDTLLAQSVGLNQSYVGKLLKIMSECKPAIVKQWRESTTVPVTVKDMYSLAALTKEKQDEEWTRILKGRAEPAARGPHAWKETARKAAEKIGFQLGTLSRLKVFSRFKDDPDGWLAVVDVCVKVKDEATITERRAIGKHAAAGFTKGQQEPEEAADDEGEEDEATGT